MGSKGNFFAVDRRVWDRLCGLQKMNLAVAYLVLASGSQGNLKTTSWSANAIEKYTGIPRSGTYAAIAGLIEAGFIKQQQGGRKPRYSLCSAEDVCTDAPAKERRLKPKQARLLEAAMAHPEGIHLPRKDNPDPNWPEGVPWGDAQALIGDGLVRRLHPSGIAPVQPAAPDSQGDWIWLPNSIVVGAAGEQPPVERLRRTHTLTALRLYIDLYHAQMLHEVGGVGWRQIRHPYVGINLGQYGQYDLYEFEPAEMGLEVFDNTNFFKKYLRPTREDYAEETSDGEAERDARRKRKVAAFWADVTVLLNTGLIEFVPHLVDADSPDGTVLHPLAREGEGEASEREIGAAAHAAALRMLTVIGQPGPWPQEVRLAPVERHIRHVALVGLLRLRHRAHTTATAEWMSRSKEWAEGAERYRRLEKACSAAA